MKIRCDIAILLMAASLYVSDNSNIGSGFKYASCGRCECLEDAVETYRCLADEMEERRTLVEKIKKEIDACEEVVK